MKKHITALDGLRGIAILLVLFTHLLPHRQAGSALAKIFNGMAGIGWSGVDVFFVLSGFLITGILYDSKGSDFYFRNFYMRRTLRIVPLYLLLLICCTLVFPHFSGTQGSAPTAHKWMFWLYLSNILVAFRGAVSVGWLGPLWSLAVEEHFYLFWPAVIFFSSRRMAMQICLVCVVLANVSRLLFLAHHNLLGPYVFTLSRIDELAWGSLIALAFTEPTGAAVLQRYVTPVAILAGGATAVLFIWRHGVILDTVMLALGLPIVGLFAASLLTLAVLPGSARPWKALLNAAVLRQFGRYSYGLYLLHMPVWELMMQHHVLFAQHSRLADYANMVLAIAISFVVAFFSFHLFELRFLALKRFFPSGKLRSPQMRAVALTTETQPHHLSLEVQL